MDQREEKTTGKEALKELEGIYLSESGQKVEELKVGLKAVQVNPRDEKALDELCRHFHNLAGSGATYGFPAISELAKAAEEVLKPVVARKATLNIDTMSILNQALASLDSYFEHARKEGKAPDVIPQPLRKLQVVIKEFQIVEDMEPKESTGLHVLVVDDDSKMADLIRTYLELDGYTVDVAYTGEEAIQGFERRKPDLMVLDVNLPDMEGFKVAEKVKKNPMGAVMPLLYVTSRSGLNDRLHALKTGADGYITKPFRPEELVATVDALVERYAKTKEQLLYDPLTAAFNRRYMYERIKEEIGRYERTEEVFSIAFVDIDHFKEINDTYGHLAGDEILVGLVAFLKSKFRSFDVVSRFGGEEFLILLPGADAEAAFKLMDRIRSELETHIFSISSLKEGSKITISAGVQHMTKNIRGPDDLIFQADRALYAAKDAGRNRVVRL